MVQAIGASGLASYGPVHFDEREMRRVACQVACWDDESKEPKRYLKEEGHELLCNNKVCAGTLAITNPAVLALVAASDRVREGLAAAGHHCPDLGTLGYNVNTRALFLSADPLVRARVACVYQKWATVSYDGRAVALQKASLPFVEAAPPPEGQRMSLGAASKSVGGPAVPSIYKPLPRWPAGAAVMTQRMVEVISDLGVKGTQYGIHLYSAGKYRVSRVEGMKPTDKQAFGTAIAALQGTEAAEVAVVESLLASGGEAALLQHMRIRDGASGVWGWKQDYSYQLNAALRLPPVLMPDVAERFVLTNDWPGRVPRRGGRRAVPTLAAAVPLIGGGGGAASSAAVEVAYSHFCDDGGNKGGPVRQSLEMEKADVIRAIGERAVQRRCRGWRTGGRGENWNSAPWTVSFWGGCV